MTGEVRLELFRGAVTVTGRRSPFSLYREEFATFGRDEVYRQADAEGFIRLYGLPQKIRYLMREASSVRPSTVLARWKLKPTDGEAETVRMGACSKPETMS